MALIRPSKRPHPVEDGHDQIEALTSRATNTANLDFDGDGETADVAGASLPLRLPSRGDFATSSRRLATNTVVLAVLVALQDLERADLRGNVRRPMLRRAS